MVSQDLNERVNGLRVEQSPEPRSLGMEARSILKSIETEDSKLVHASALTRSDRHYFRARYNYYRLCLIRLNPEERAGLEPSLSRFLAHISGLEAKEDAVDLEKPSAFLGPVQSVSKPSNSRPEAPRQSFSDHPLKSADSLNLDTLKADIVAQLTLVQLALKAEATPESQRIVIQGIERVIKDIRDL